MISIHQQKTKVPESIPKKQGGKKTYPGPEPFQQKPLNNQDAGAPVQRVLLRTPTEEQHTINLTRTISQFTEFGLAYIQLNGVELPGGNFAGAVVPPPVQVEAAGENNFTARFTGEPANIIGCRVALPAPPPWETEMTVNNLNVRLAMIQPGLALSDDFVDNKPNRNLLVYLKGLPGDAEFAALVRQHEMHHVEDLETAIDNSIGPWDQAIHDAVTAGTTVNGASAQEAEAALFAHVGGTAAAIGTAFRNQLRILGEAFHNEEEGHSPTLNRVEEQKRFLLRDIVRVYYDHPMAD